MYFGATCLSQRLDWTSALPLVFPVRQRRVFMKYHTSILPYEYTLSLKALFAPEVDGRGALGLGADAVEAIFCKVQTDNLLVLGTQSSNGWPDVAGGAARSLPHSRECTRHYKCKTSFPQLLLSPQPLLDDGFREYLSGFQHALVSDCLFSFSLVMKTIWLQGDLRAYLPS